MQIAEAPKPPQALRAAYLDGLPQPQELYVEVLVAAGATRVVRDHDETLGYGVVHGGALVELHCAAPARLAEVFEALTASGAIRRVLAKTFDSPMVSLGLEHGRGWRIVGRLYRDVVDASFTGSPDIAVRKAAPGDLARATAVDPAFFEDPGITAGLIERRGLFLYEREGVLLGCGLLDRVVRTRNDFDLGVAVAPAHRGQGLGAYIIAHLKSLCLERGVRPICGHDVANVASQRSLERAGFASRHRLVAFDL